jgi:hypothetical protein
MKHGPLLKKIVPMALICSAPALAEKKLTENDLQQALGRPLITGASISADRLTTSPGKRLALRYTKSDQIQTVAFGGRTGKEIIKALSPGALKDRTAVLAVDLFFWDSILPQAGPSIEALHHLIDQVKEKNIPIVLGEIPELLPGHQPSRGQLNAAIKEASKSYDKCYVMPFSRLFSKIKKDGFLKIGNRHYSFFDLAPDGLHIGEKASEYLANVMHDEMLGRVRDLF